MSAGYTLLPRRTTELLYEEEKDGVPETLEDTWMEADAHRTMEKQWTGRTTFYMDTNVPRTELPSPADVCFALVEEHSHRPVTDQRLSLIHN